MAIGRQPLLVQCVASIGLIVANGPLNDLQEWRVRSKPIMLNAAIGRCPSLTGRHECQKGELSFRP